MNLNTYLTDILEQQTLGEGSKEVEEMEKHKGEVTTLLLETFDASQPLIKYAGSRAKGTMIKQCYDLDVVCYFENGDLLPGDSLEDVYHNVKEVLEQNYIVQPKNSALRIKSKKRETLDLDFHVDVVPGRFTDEKQHDAYLYVAGNEKNRQKTNLKKHLKHVRQSKVLGIIRLAKYWNLLNSVGLRTFVLELLVIKALETFDEDQIGYSECFIKFMDYITDNGDELYVEDPANPYGNDLTSSLEPFLPRLIRAAKRTNDQIGEGKFESIFGTVSSAPRISILTDTVSSRPNAPKPWGAS